MLQVRRPQAKAGAATRLSREESLDAWNRIALALGSSDNHDDRILAKEVAEFVKDMPMLRRQRTLQREAGQATAGARQEKLPSGSNRRRSTAGAARREKRENYAMTISCALQ